MKSQKELSNIARQLGKRGGKTTHALYPDHLKKISKKGGEATKKNNPNHFREIGKKGNEARWKKRKVI